LVLSSNAPVVPFDAFKAAIASVNSTHFGKAYGCTKEAWNPASGSSKISSTCFLTPQKIVHDLLIEDIDMVVELSSRRLGFRHFCIVFTTKVEIMLSYMFISESSDISLSNIEKSLQN